MLHYKIFVNSSIYYRWCGQDWPRSIVFSLTSLLVPSGYANDPFYYQLPNQNLLKPQVP